MQRRKKIAILSISDEDDSTPIKQRDSEDSLGVIKKDSRKEKNKKDLPIAPLRNLRKRK